jgi:hypothetical protein
MTRLVGANDADQFVHDVDLVLRTPRSIELLVDLKQLPELL